MGSSDTTNGAPALRYIPLTYTPADSQASALRLILTLFPHWEGPGNKIEFVRFTDGITNTVRPYRLPSRHTTTDLDLAAPENHQPQGWPDG
jgi:hypothetical protein